MANYPPQNPLFLLLALNHQTFKKKPTEQPLLDSKIYRAPVAEVSVVLPEMGLAWPHHPDGHQLESLLLKPEIRLKFRHC
jgi:hypothetical protein